ncbi:pilus assembly protein PilP [uncultured Tateyamaria sp.]|uniref:pilus assembly protein PilP n=1 Tax=uncultured Tateyamaria sp. TaxID=455651 RepID=UPI00262B02AC|nr:pilus assembly protein PilP [uncultured Tateyamaria sp.]
MSETPDTENPETATNATTAELATQTGALPLNSLQLIGVAGTEDNRRALLRAGNGSIQTVQVGDNLRQGTVVAIADDAVILSSATGSRQLRMPQAPEAPRVAA